MDWDLYRRVDGSIDLARAFDDRLGWEQNKHIISHIARKKAQEYLTAIEGLQKINSRQVAAVALTTARYIYNQQAEG